MRYVHLTHSQRMVDRLGREHRRRSRQQERDNMTDEEIERRMCKIIRAKLELGEEISFDDFSRDNIPRDKIKPFFQKYLKRVQGRMDIEHDQ